MTARGACPSASDKKSLGARPGWSSFPSTNLLFPSSSWPRTASGFGRLAAPTAPRTEWLAIFETPIIPIAAEALWTNSRRELRLCMAFPYRVSGIVLLDDVHGFVKVEEP